MTSASTSSAPTRERLLGRGSSASSAWPSSTTTDSSFRMTSSGSNPGADVRGGPGRPRRGNPAFCEWDRHGGFPPCAPSEQLVGEGVRRRRGPGGHPELEEDVAHVPVDGL